MATIEISFQQQIPDGISNEQIMTWLRYRLGVMAQLDDSNLLANTEFDALFYSVKMKTLNGDARAGREGEA